MNEKKNIRIANCSGYYGDKLSAARDLIEGGPIDVLTGDYLAELTMGILYSQRLKRGEDKGFVGTFLKQYKDIAKICQSKGIKIVVNAGGLNPQSMTTQLNAINEELSIDLKVAYIDGDDISVDIKSFQDQGEEFIHIDRNQPLKSSDCQILTANIYLGAWGIVKALDLGADVVICPRVTDASLVIGPAAWKFKWKRNDYHKLAGALTAGHIIECGAQTTGGNYAFFEEVGSFKDIGYPIAEVYEDGSFIVTKHQNTGGMISEGTVTAQLLYEISSPDYINPDVIGHFDSLVLEDLGKDRVLVSGCTGEAPNDSHKVCINLAGGYRNGMELILTGLDIEKKAETFVTALFDLLGGKEQFDDVTIDLHRTDKIDPMTHEEAMAILRIDLKSKDPKLVGRLFTAKIIELALANYPGFFSKTPPGPGTPFIRYWPALIDSKHVYEKIHFSGEEHIIRPTCIDYPGQTTKRNAVNIEIEKASYDELENIPLGRIIGARSGDKGGCANLGIWTKTNEAYSFIYHYLTVEQLRKLLPDLNDYEIERYDFPNIKSLNFYIKGILEDGASSNTKVDALAKSLGEYLRAKYVNVPKQLLNGDNDD
ncbi:DUF1446 domain-containing protein [Gammaproteobacteria bacterium]|nr:DUF1446 domain-containing protein [Gammaproteobacteria bacterium]